jgi:regulator of nucleoside diphosphate kinase
MNMTNFNELLVSARDAEALAPIVGDRRRADRFEADAADALAEVLMDARMVPYDRLPADRVAINSRVTYREVPHGEPRTVVLVHPSDANATEGRISVLSPVGRALLGRKPGAVSSMGTPGGRTAMILVLAAERSAEVPSRSMKGAE